MPGTRRCGTIGADVLDTLSADVLGTLFADVDRVSSHVLVVRVSASVGVRDIRLL